MYHVVYGSWTLVFVTIVEEATVKIGHNVRTTNKWVGFNPNNILNNTGI